MAVAATADLKTKRVPIQSIIDFNRCLFYGWAALSFFSAPARARHA